MANNVVLFCGLKTYQIHIVLNASRVMERMIVTGKEYIAVLHKIIGFIQPATKVYIAVQLVQTILRALNATMGIRNTMVAA
jgi:hypothetical protein